MTRLKPHRLWPVLCLLVSMCPLAHAEDTRPDPMRPPEAWLALQPKKAAPTTDADDNSGARVTIIGKQQRYAVVDGQVVKPGDMVNGAKVLSIQPNSVTVRQNDGRKHLSLTPGVEKKPSVPAARAKSVAPAQ